MKPIKCGLPPLRVLFQFRKGGDYHEICKQNHVSDGINKCEERNVATGKVIDSEPNQQRKRSVMKDVISRHQNRLLAEHKDNSLEHVCELNDEECIAMIHHLKGV